MVHGEKAWRFGGEDPASGHDAKGPPIVGMQGQGPQPTITLILKDGTARADIPMTQIDLSHN